MQLTVNRFTSRLNLQVYHISYINFWVLYIIYVNFSIPEKSDVCIQTHALLLWLIMIAVLMEIKTDAIFLNLFIWWFDKDTSFPKCEFTGNYFMVQPLQG